MGLVHGDIEHLRWPPAFRIGRFFVSQDLRAVPSAGRGVVPAAMQGHHHQIKFSVDVFHPAHPVNGWLVGQFNWFPFLLSVGGRNQKENGAAVERVARVPACAGRQFRFAIAVNVPGRNANMIEAGQLFGNDMFFPRWILVPNDLVFIRQDDVRLFVPIHIGNRHAITNLDFRIDLDCFENRRAGSSR